MWRRRSDRPAGVEVSTLDGLAPDGGTRRRRLAASWCSLRTGLITVALISALVLARALWTRPQGPVVRRVLPPWGADPPDDEAKTWLEAGQEWGPYRGPKLWEPDACWDDYTVLFDVVPPHIKGCGERPPNAPASLYVAPDPAPDASVADSEAAGSSAVAAEAQGPAAAARSKDAALARYATPRRATWSYRATSLVMASTAPTDTELMAHCFGGQVARLAAYHPSKLSLREYPNIENFDTVAPLPKRKWRGGKASVQLGQLHEDLHFRPHYFMAAPYVFSREWMILRQFSKYCRERPNTLWFDRLPDKPMHAPQMRASPTNREHLMRVLLGRQVDTTAARRRVYIDLGARDYASSVEWMLRHYPAVFDEIYVFEAQPGSFWTPTVERMAWRFTEAMRLLTGLTVSEEAALAYAQEMQAAIRVVPGRPGTKDSGEPGEREHTVDLSRYMMERLELKREDFVVVRMDVDGDEYDLVDAMRRARALDLVTEMFVAVHYADPVMGVLRWDQDRKYRRFTLQDAAKLMESLREQDGVHAHVWPGV